MTLSREILNAAHELLEISEAERDHRLVELAARLVAHSAEVAKVESEAELLRACGLARLRP